MAGAEFLCPPWTQRLSRYAENLLRGLFCGPEKSRGGFVFGRTGDGKTSQSAFEQLTGRCSHLKESTMNPIKHFPTLDRRVLLSSLAMLPLLSATLRSTSASAQAQPIRCRPGTRGRPRLRSSTLSRASRRKAGLTSYRSISASRPSTMTARSGSSSRCMCNWPSSSTA